MTNAVVLGGGLWGAVLANHLAQGGHPVTLWEFFDQLAEDLRRTRRHPHIPGWRLDPGVQVTSDLQRALRSQWPRGKGPRTWLIVAVLPSKFMRETARSMRVSLRTLWPRPIVVSASKGLEPKSLRTMSEVLEEELPFLKGRVFALSGPTFAREVARGVPTQAVLAGPSRAMGLKAVEALEGKGLKLAFSPDRRGIELGGFLKNVLAIGCGLLDGLGLGANTKAALITLGAVEMERLIARLGGLHATPYGLAGMGDLVATGTSPESRNRSLGERLGKGKSLSAALREIPTVAEGVEASASVLKLLKRTKVKAPILRAVCEVVRRRRSPRDVLSAMGFNHG